MDRFASLGRIMAIAHTTFREAARDRVPLGLFASGLALGVASLLIAAMSIARDRSEVVAVLTTAGLSFFSIVGAIVLGASLIYKDLERKTVFPILARAIHRHELLVGKHLGLVATVGTFGFLDGALALTLTTLAREDRALMGRALAGWVVMGAIAVVVTTRARDRATPFLAIAPVLFLVEAVAVGPLGTLRTLVSVSVVLAIVESSIVAGISIVLGAFSTPFLTAALTTGLVIIGRNADWLGKLPERTFGKFMVGAGRAISRVVPNLQLYVPPRIVSMGQAGSPLGYVVDTAAYGLLYTAILLVMAALIFRKRDFS